MYSHLPVEVTLGLTNEGTIQKCIFFSTVTQIKLNYMCIFVYFFLPTDLNKSLLHCNDILGVVSEVNEV